eukprot:gene42122-biopygen5635
MQELRTNTHDMTVDPTEIHQALTEHFKGWYAQPANDVQGLHNTELDWGRIFTDQEYFMARTAGTQVPEKYRTMAFSALSVEGTDVITDTLTLEFQNTPTIDEFLDVVTHCPNTSAPGPTGLTYAMIKAWPAETQKMAYQALAAMWEDRQIPPWWKWRWLIPVPKKTDPTLADLRPLTLVETTRKIWSKLIIRRIVRAWDKADIMHNAQHGFRTAMSTMTAILQYINAAEEAQELKLPIHRSSWDMTKAFDTVSKNAMMIAWLRLGVPLDIALWLVELDRSGVTIVRTPAAKKAWKDRHYQGIQAPGNLYSASMRPITPNQLLSAVLAEAFDAERGTGQGDVTSPLCWTALFDILLRMLDAVDRDPFMCRGANGRLYCAGETAFADDMESTTATNTAMQIKAEVVSAFCLIFELSISPAKLRRYFQDWSRNVTAAELVDMIVYTSGWQPYTVKIEVEGNTPYLGGQYPITSKDAKEMLNDMLDTARRHCQGILHTSGSPTSKLMAVTISTHKKIQYIAKISSYSLAQYRQLDKIFAAYYRRITMNMTGYPTALMHIATERGGLGIPRLSDLIQQDKLGAIWQGLEHTDKNLMAIQGLLERALRQGGHTTGTYGVQIQHDYKDGEMQWIRSVAEWLQEDGLYLTKAQQQGRTLDNTIYGSTGIRQRDNDELQKLGITTLADIYHIEEATPEATWKLPRHLKLEYILDGLPSAATITTSYTMKVGQYWEITSGTTATRKGTIIEIKGWDTLTNNLTVGLWIQYAGEIWLRHGHKEDIRQLDLRETTATLRRQLYLGQIRHTHYRRHRRVLHTCCRHQPNPTTQTTPTYGWLHFIREQEPQIPNPCIYTDGSWAHTDITMRTVLKPSGEAPSTRASASVIVINGTNWQDYPQIVLHITEGEMMMCKSAFTMEYMALAAATAIKTEIQTQEPIRTDCQAVVKILASRHYHLRQKNTTHRTLLQYATMHIEQGQCLPEHLMGHPERREPNREKWTRDQWGNHLADRAAEGDTGLFTKLIYKAITARQLSGELTIPGQWYLGDENTIPDDGELIQHRATARLHREYLLHRDQHRTGPAIWQTNTAGLAAQSYGINTQSSIMSRSTFSRLIYDKGWHGGNISKNSTTAEEHQETSRCVLCTEQDSQYHWICECTGAENAEARLTMCTEAHKLANDMMRGHTGPTGEYSGLGTAIQAINGYYLDHYQRPRPGSERIWLNNWNQDQIMHITDMIGPIAMTDVTKLRKICVRWGKHSFALIRYLWVIKQQPTSIKAEELKREQVSRAEESREFIQPTEHQEGTVTVAEQRPRRDRLPEGFYAEEPRAEEGVKAQTQRRREDPCPRDPGRVYIYVSDSPLGPFKGAFARKFIEAGVRIAQYTGKYTNKGTHTHYLLHDPVADIYRDAWDHNLQRVRCLAGFLNDPLDQHRANCKFSMVNGRMYVETIVPIPANDELLVPYGDEYWLNNDFDVNTLDKAYAEYKKEATMDRWQTKIAKANDGTTQTERNGTPIQQRPTV